MTDRVKLLKAAAKAARRALDYHDRTACTHETTHRGGFIWTICDDCGRKWADDEGGFVPYTDAPAISELRSALDALPAEPVKETVTMALIRAAVMRAGSECADMGNEIVRLRAEIASLRVTLGQQPPTEGAEPVGCPLPGMCVMVHDNAILRARVAQLEAALRKIANSGIETFAIHVIGGDDIRVECSSRFAHERDVAAIMATARAALEEKP